MIINNALENNTNNTNTVNVTNEEVTMESTVESTTAVATATSVEVRLNPVQAEVQRRMQQEAARITAEVRKELFGPKAKKLLQKAPTVLELMDALKNEDAEFTQFVFSTARVNFGVEAQGQANVGTPRKQGEAVTVASNAVPINESTLLAALSAATEPMTIGTLAKGLGSTPDAIRPTLKSLVEDKKVVQSGEKRATVYVIATNASQATHTSEATSSEAQVVEPSNTNVPEVSSSEAI